MNPDDPISKIFEVVEKECKERYEGQMLSIHVSLCGYPEREQEAYADTRTYFSGYHDGIQAVKRCFNARF